MSTSTKIIMILLSSFFTNSFLFAQQALQEKYDTETIYLQGNKYYKNGQKYPGGFLFSKLGNEMQVSPASINEFDQYKKKRNTTLLLLGISLTSAIIGAVSVDDELQSGLLITTYSTMTLALTFSISAQNKLQKAIWQRNRDVLFF